MLGKTLTIESSKLVLISIAMIGMLGVSKELIQAGTQNLSLAPTGRILLLDNSTRIGTAFVAGETNNVFLPAHVAVADTLLFKPYGSNFSFRITIKYVLDQFDLAIYERTGGEQSESYPLGDLNRMRPGDAIIYFGWETDRTLNIFKSFITSKGQTIHKNEIVDFVDIVGHGIPGYSGGPVFNTNGEVVAMIVQGWDYTPIEAESSIRVMRAFSVDLLRILEQKLDNTTAPDSLAQSDKLRLIELIDKK